MKFIRTFREVGLADVPSVGGKNASLGELVRNLTPLGIRVPHGFAVTADAYRYFLRSADLTLMAALGDVRQGDVKSILRASERVRDRILATPLPADLTASIVESYARLSRGCEEEASDVAVRSSATAEDLPNASFAGQQESFLNVRGAASVCEAVKKAFASLFTPRAISYRLDMGFDHESVALSVGVQKMVRSDLASAGVIFTLDPETGHRGVVLVTSSYGLGESVVQGRVVPDQFYVHKAKRALFSRTCGTKEVKLIYDQDGHRQVKTVPVDEAARARLSLGDDDVRTLADWAVAIEEHYGRVRGAPTPMDIEWAKDGVRGDLYIVQARPETVHSQRGPAKIRLCEVRGQLPPVATGLAVGDGAARGSAHVILDAKQLTDFAPGEVLVAETTDPDWEPIMKQAAAIVTEHGGRTSHAAIVARELGIPAVVGVAHATKTFRDDEPLTVSCAEGAEGRIYVGDIEFTVQEVDPSTMPRPRTELMLNVGNPGQALKLSLLPSDGVGLARMEFILASIVGIHPLALSRFDSLPADLRRQVDERTRGYSSKTEYFVDRVSQGIATMAAAFWPRPVILRFSDFKTNEYAHLLGGSVFEPHEENPMLGWRGASRYYHPNYKDGFLLEVAAVRRVRETLGLDNLRVMIPFCRTPEEARRVLSVMNEAGLERGQNGLMVYMMAEIPSNIILAEQFAKYFDGFSIGSNDLTQLTLGVDRDGATVADLFDERDEAVKLSCARLIEVAHAEGRKASICGQAPSDFPEFATFLVEHGIDSISLNPDALLRTARSLAQVEHTRERNARRDGAQLAVRTQRLHRGAPFDSHDGLGHGFAK